VPAPEPEPPAPEPPTGGADPVDLGASIAYGTGAHLSGLPIGKTYSVGSSSTALLPEIRALLPNLRPGDAIIVRDGSYQLKTDILKWPATASGNASAPIFLLAESAGGVRLSGNLEWRLKGKHLHVAGFRFVGTTGPVVLEGDYARFTSNTFERAEIGLGIYASRVEIDNNIWSGTLGQSLWHAQPHVGCGNTNTCLYYKHNRIHHNTWQDIAKTKPNGLEPIMLGYGYAPLPSGYDNATHARIDHNVFSNARGDGEVISIKSDSNTIEHNCIVNSGAGALVIRMGSNNRISDNEIVGSSTTGIRISGESNIIENNVFATSNSSVAAIDLHNAEKTEASSVYYRYMAAKNNTVSGNTFHGYNYSVRDYPATGILVRESSNNVVEYNEFKATRVAEPGVRADRHRSAAEFLRDNRIAENQTSASTAHADSGCPE